MRSSGLKCTSLSDWHRLLLKALNPLFLIHAVSSRFIFLFQLREYRKPYQKNIYVVYLYLYFLIDVIL